MSSNKSLRRYTDIPALIYLLRNRSITLLDPRSWEDSNDSYYLHLYKKKRGLQSLLTLCFTQGPETYHLWRVFASGPSGVCIQFNRSKLFSAFDNYGTITSRRVHYLTLDAEK